MKQFVKHLSSTHFTAPLVITLVLAAPIPALADKCSAEDRRPLPRCLFIDGGANGLYTFINDCDYDVVVKADVRWGSDTKIRSFPGTSITRHIGGHIREFSCCPRYMSGPCG